jgi:hypothetical protein
MNNTKQIRLLAGARNVQLDKTLSNDNITTLTYTCPAYTTKTCIHQIAGKWEIKTINLNKVTLVNHNQIIK